MWWRRGTRMPLPGVRLSPASLCVCVLLMVSLAVAAVLVQAGLCGGGAWVGCVPGRGLGGGHMFGWRGKKSLSQGSPPVGVEALVQLRRDIARTLLVLATDLRTGRTEGVADQLEATASFLDPRYHHQGPPWSPPTITRPAFSPPPLNTPLKHPRNLSGEPRDVYKGMGSHAVDWIPGRDELVGLNSSPPLSLDVQVTVLVDGCATPPNYLVGVVRQAVGTWPGVGVVVGVAEAQRAEVEDVSGLPGVQLITVLCGIGERGALPDLIGATATPYALVLSGVSAVTRDLDLSRLLSVAVGLRDRDVGVVGGAERGRDGAADYTCTSLSVRNHVIEAREGYRYSAAACVYCDVTSGSFLAPVAVLREVAPDPALPRAAQALDWALRLQHAGVLTLTCPDVMFHVTREVRGRAPAAAKRQASEDKVCSTPEERKAARAAAWQARRQYRKLAQKWEVSAVVLNNGTRLEYSCREVGIDCSPRQRTRYYSLPPCCLALKGRMLAAMDLVSREEHIPYNINAGTLLGALKFHGPLPWDFDEDVLTEYSGVNAFMRHMLRLRRLGLSLHNRNPTDKKSDATTSTTSTSHASGSGSSDNKKNKNSNSNKNKNKNKNNNSGKVTYAVGTGAGGFSMDVWPWAHLPTRASLTALAALPDHLPCLMHAHEPTAIREARAHPQNASSCHLASLIRVGGVWAPASWNPGRAALYKYGDGLYRHEAHWRWWKGGDWSPCPRPGHHACLDLHPLDGSLPFL
ncbi:uncharacterized protein LOC123502560 [Portunus trituberculatus]|uniref:uncharacterized protein LOC123502560 n=1 Tax=Portunus trituberculatus TaxID=210409 RepID=UPI001E1CBD29|nr:uncharacterized protein LOC123502560 [Portunus trituberculatus]XP_045107635.1 uncharacterized protein LOC123502560 [Portunus trituberculatus]